ncbi:hypothetical protein [Fibrella forsythiae]|uniref:Uncharacterized protein n=1 Tax=Fibrella forsythiae TaxID=2817061 RepID=A0ABS3JNY2_9BACT|nr:hypothetical protein [Fibrella forsythiae]MBO0951716.1 hypothetical protein [Fibrella forsythiae]
MFTVNRLYIRSSPMPMTTNHPSISETPDVFIVNGIAVPKMKRGQIHTYDPAIIKAIGPDLFF